MPGRPNTARRDAVMQLLGAGMTPREAARALGVTANAIYNIRRMVVGGPVRPVGAQASDEPAFVRCCLRGSHRCLTADSIYWQPLAAR